MILIVMVQRKIKKEDTVDYVAVVNGRLLFPHPKAAISPSRLNSLIWNIRYELLWSDDQRLSRSRFQSAYIIIVLSNLKTRLFIPYWVIRKLLPSDFDSSRGIKNGQPTIKSNLLFSAGCHHQIFALSVI